MADRITEITKAPEVQNSTKEAINQKLQALGIPSKVVKQGPEAVKVYAEANHIDLSGLERPPINSVFTA